MEKKIPFASGNILADFILRSLEGEIKTIPAIKNDLKKQYEFDEKIFDMLMNDLIEHKFISMKGENLVISVRGRHVLKECPEQVTLDALYAITEEHEDSFYQPSLKQSPRHMLGFGARARQYFPLVIPATFIIFLLRVIYTLFIDR